MTDPNVDAETTAPPDDSVPFAGLDIEIGPLAYGTARLGEEFFALCALTLLGFAGIGLMVAVATSP